MASPGMATLSKYNNQNTRNTSISIERRQTLQTNNLPNLWAGLEHIPEARNQLPAHRWFAQEAEVHEIVGPLKRKKNVCFSWDWKYEISLTSWRSSVSQTQKVCHVGDDIEYALKLSISQIHNEWVGIWARFAGRAAWRDYIRQQQKKLKTHFQGREYLEANSKGLILYLEEDN